MAFVSRAEKKIGPGALGSGTELSGPGAYDKKSFTDKHFYATAAFHTSEDRNITKPANFNPGPGAYAPPKSQLNVQTAGVTGAAFVNRVSRFPSSKESFAENPGPGAYAEGNKWIKRRHHRSEIEGPSAGHPEGLRVQFARLPTAPSVPSRKQSYGYEEGNSGELVMQKPPEGGFSGFGGDTVGPAGYTPQYGQVTKTKATSWGRSRARRSNLASGEAADTPGPGRYERTGRGVASFSEASTWVAPDKLASSKPAKEKRTGGGVKGASAAAGSVDGRPRRPKVLEDDAKDVLAEDRVPPLPAKTNSMFASRSLRDHQRNVLDEDLTPGPGAYRQATSFRTRKVSDRYQFFGSTQQRAYEQEPTQLLHASTNILAPGPGAYDSVKHSSAFKPLSALLPDAAPFASTQERFQVQKAREALPGPGAYDEMNAAPGTLVTDVARRTRARGGVFGTKSQRFPASRADAGSDKQGYLFRDADGRNPGPGSYESGEGVGISNVPDETRQPLGQLMVSRQRRRAAVSAFASETKRFQDAPPPAGVVGGTVAGMPANRRVKAVTQPGNPPPGAYALEDLWAPAKRKGARSEAFSSRAQRFGQTSGDVIMASEPGPGAYQPSATNKGHIIMSGRRANNVPNVSYAGFSSNQRRFLGGMGQSKAGGPGPGSYDSYDPYKSMLHRSFNVTIDGVVF